MVMDMISVHRKTYLNVTYRARPTLTLRIELINMAAEVVIFANGWEQLVASRKVVFVVVGMGATFVLRKNDTAFNNTRSDVQFYEPTIACCYRVFCESTFVPIRAVLKI